MGPVEFAEKPIVWNLYTKNGSRIRLQLVGVRSEPIEEKAILVAEVIVESQVPLISVMRQTLWHSGSAHGKQVGIVLKCRRYGIGARVVGPKLRRGKKFCGGANRRWCLLEEGGRHTIWKVLLDKLGELGRLDSSDQTVCVGGSQQVETAKRE